MNEARPSNYWIASNALYITLNANGGPDYLLGNTASGAHILCYIKDVDGLEYDAGHNYRRWPLSLTPTHFETHTEKYVYCAIPRPGNAAEMAVIVFPSERLDIYGKNEIGQQIGSEQYYYIWLQGIISSSGVTGANDRGWTQQIDTGTLASDEAIDAGGDQTWWRYSSVDDTVTFLKEIAMDARSVFHNLKARLLVLAGHELTGVATSETAYTDSDVLVATPGYVESQYLSKTHESEAQEQIGFLKGLWVGARNLYEITANGIAKLKSLVAESVTATRIQTDSIISANYTGDGVGDTGFRLTNSHNGHSKLTIDEIYVRMKAVFESLEVRERTYTGGDQIWSCAGNQITRVDYLGNVETEDHVPQMMNVHADGRPSGQGQGDVYSVPVPGDTYGYSDVKVPWLLRQMPLLARAKVFARYRKVRIVINEPESNSTNRAAASESPLANIRRARCYFLAKDDDKEVHNWWRINDLARCQTMNLANTTRQTYISGEDEKAGNIFWWRKVIGVSYEPVTLEDGKQYHYFDVAFDYEYEQSHPEVMVTSVMEGSDIPAAHDSVVQFGNTIIEGRMNLMMMEVNGSDSVGYNPSTDAPCLKAYRGVYCFNLNKSWVGGHTCKMKLSPKTGYEFYGPNFKQVTEYDVVPVPVERGLWTGITPTRDDYREHAMVRKCYYYDKVSHNGSYWLCSIVDGAHWVNGDGNYISDADYSALTEEQKALCSRKQNYTIEEPSANSIDWIEVVAKGDNMVRLDIDNEMDAVQTDSTGKVTAQRTINTVVHLYDGATDVAIDNPTVSGINYTDANGQQQTLSPIITASGNGKQLSWTFLAGWVLQASYQISIGYTYQGVPYNTVFTLTASQGMAIFQLKPSLSAISFQRDGNNQLTPASKTLGLSILKIDGGSTADITPSTYGVSKIRYSFTEMPTLVSSGSAWSAAGTITVPNTAENVYIALFNASDVLIDKETVPIIKDGEKGDSITKSSADTYRYATNNTGVRPAVDSQDWSTTKPTLQSGYWLYTETTIHWSDGTTTILYSDERNPNDGIAGQDIIVDGATEMKYYVGDSNTTHPAEDSSDWKDLSQVTQTQGKWLWSKATTWYRKASSTAGSKDAGHSVNYNVSYISKDGKTGRGIQSITEYYQATNSSASRQAPTSESGWDTNPNLSHLTDKWDQSHKYLWNMEKTVYTNVDGSTTTEYSIPQILAIWTKDGDAGRGIDSIVNYYKVTSSATAPSKPATPGTDGWSTTPTAPGQGEYLWNYERITWVNPSSTTETDVQMIGYAGTNGYTPQKGTDYNDGADAVNVSLSPEEVIVTQSTTSPYGIDLSNAETAVSVNEGGVPKSFTISNVSGTHCTASVKSGTTDTIKIDSIGTYNVTVDGETVSRYYDNGYVTFDVTYGGNTYRKRFNFYANLLGTWKETVEAGVRTVVAREVDYDFLNGVLVVNNKNYTQIASAAQEFNQWASNYQSASGENVNNLNSRISNAEGNISTIQRNAVTKNLLGRRKWTLNATNNPYADYDAPNDRWYDKDSVANDIYSQVVSLKAGKYCFYGYIPNTTSFSNTNIALQKGATASQPWGTASIQPSSWGEVSNDTITINSRTYHRYYAVFTLDEDSNCTINLWSSADESDIAVPCLCEGETPSIETSMSMIRQTADNIELKVKECGINIDDKEIDLTAGKVNFKMPGGGTNPKISIDPTTGTLHAVDGKFSGNIYTPYLRLTSSNISQYEITNWRGETVVNLGATGNNIQVEVSGVSISLPRITEDMLGCEINIFNATTGTIEITGSGVIGSVDQGAYFCNLLVPSQAGNSLRTNTPVTLQKFKEIKVKAIYNGQGGHEAYNYTWLVCYANINP